MKQIDSSIDLEAFAGAFERFYKEVSNIWQETASANN